MKIKASSLAKLTLGLLVAGSIAACNSNKTGDKAATSSVATGGIVFINQDTLLAKYEYFKDMTKRLDDKNKAATNDVGARQQAIQREYVDYQKSANTLSADQRATTEQRLSREGQDFQTYKQNAGAQLQNDAVAEQTKFYEKVSEFAKGYAKEKGYKLVLTFQKGNANLLYGDPGLDVTADVVKRLNEAYAKDKK
ncbi:MAG TPA: OmpH family outer membrane protein [Mucilaginibacter sp.]|nr:OmpH family outer membrane protein [Mucilaginibacter sp.]